MTWDTYSREEVSHAEADGDTPLSPVMEEV